MRVLVATTPGWGHVAPVLPVADELIARGHEVRWLTAADAALALGERNIEVRIVGMPLGERLPRARAMLTERTVGLQPNEMRAHAFTVHFALLAATSSFGGIAAEVAMFRPDVIVREPAELASALVGSNAGVPVVTVGFGALVPKAALQMADEALGTRVTELGLAPGDDRLHLGDLYLHPMPASLDTTDVPQVVRRIQPLRPPHAPQLPEELHGFAVDRPGVYCTFGTEFGPLAPWSEVLGALGTLDVDALVTTGAAPLPEGTVHPPRVRVARYVDQSAVLHLVAVVISHAGSGSLLGAAAAGVPQVCIPLGADQFENAAAASARGIAVTVPPPSRSADAIAAAARAAMADARMAAAAREVAAEIDELPTARTAVQWIEALLRTT